MDTEHAGRNLFWEEEGIKSPSLQDAPGFIPSSVCWALLWARLAEHPLQGEGGAAVVSCLVDENDASSESLPTRQAQMGRIDSRQHHQESVSKPNYGLFPVSRKGHSKPWKPN